jgi:hypothetical protein
MTEHCHRLCPLQVRDLLETGGIEEMLKSLNSQTLEKHCASLLKQEDRSCKVKESMQESLVWKMRWVAQGHSGLKTMPEETDGQFSQTS